VNCVRDYVESCFVTAVNGFPVTGIHTVRVIYDDRGTPRMTGEWLMWLPAPLYRNAPYFWMLLGIALVAVGTVGIQNVDFFIGLLCMACGAASCFWSVYIALYRQGHPEITEALPSRYASSKSVTDPELDQTCELSYRPEKPLN
jgi:hypothetical protein